ncbi:PREDICTED: uncharacterized protein LOC104734815 [Camelina sativa]|uniref:Uncharacterized protein LOC104734815 n=1 Tax=Camelina sativa TaxID=90675 RepID=A0ABM0V933_CAMSA|nr:PREDICTED: uncharacterized protein LOC104734815 [Camelina sativa]
MPGNEFGERIHNFFGQEGLSQDQPQVADGSWSGFSNGLVSNQRQIDPSLIANLKSYSTQQSVDPERGQPSNSQHGLYFNQQPMRSEYSRSVLQEHQQPANGYMHGNLALQASPNEANFSGVDVESSRDKLSGRGFTPDIHKIPMRFDMGESPVNYDFLGGQQQSNTQLPGMLQPFPRQQMTFNDMQLLKQQVMFKQMHEYQMQQQLQKQQLEARQLNSLNSNAVNGSRSSDNQSHPYIGGVPLQDASNNWLQPDLMTGNTNWMHRGISPVVQGSSNGLMITPEHGQPNLMVQQLEPSLYGMPVGGTNAPQNAISSVQMNRLAAQHGSANMSSSLTNQPMAFLNQGDVQANHMVPGSTYQENVFSHISVPGSNNRPNFESFQSMSGQDKFGQMEGSGLSENSFVKVSENINTLQKSSTLDPTEEKILFGSDDNLWEAFGNSTDMSLTGNLISSSSDIFDPCSSLQSGSWSALMQSAVAETSSNDAGVHEWGSKQQSVWANSNTTPHADSHIGNRGQDSGVKASNALSDRVHSNSTGSTVQHLEDKGNTVSDDGLLEKPMTQNSQMAGNMFHSLSSGINVQNDLCSTGKNEVIDDRPGNWNAASNPSSAALMGQKNHFTQMQRANYGAGNDSSALRDVQGNIQQHPCNNSVEKAIHQLKSGDSSQILESYASNNAGKVMAESNEMGNSGKENSSDSFRSKFSPESLTQANAHSLHVFPGGKETQSPSRSLGLVVDGLNHNESANYMLHFGQTVSQSFSNKNPAASAGADHQQISPQIAPSRYSQYEAFKKGQVQHVNDTGRFTLLKNSVDGLHSAQPFKQLDTTDPGYVVHMQQMSSTPGAETLLSTSLPNGATDQLLKDDKPRKRKTATSGLLSWNKEIMQGPQRLKTLGEAEVDWARATNRFTEKVEFVTLLEDDPPIRSKRRLIYTTQLMQQLFRPLPDRVVSLVASSNYEFVAYTAARAALGDACSSTSTDRSGGFSPPNNSNPLSERTKTEKISDQYISKAAEDFISRTRKLETDFAGLENGTTITDLRIEVQDLERFAVINRFASFHQSSPSMDRTVSPVRLNPQRYVTIAPMPQHIPDRVQCLSF